LLPVNGSSNDIMSNLLIPLTLEQTWESPLNTKANKKKTFQINIILWQAKNHCIHQSSH